jgi:hypothetical protein
LHPTLTGGWGAGCASGGWGAGGWGYFWRSVPLDPINTCATFFSPVLAFSRVQHYRLFADFPFFLIGAGAAVAGALGLKAAVGAAVPAIMSGTGTVVAGVGTFHGGLTATVAAFAAAPLSIPIVLGIGGVGAAVTTVYKACSYFAAPEPDPSLMEVLRGWFDL